MNPFNLKITFLALNVESAIAGILKLQFRLFACRPVNIPIPSLYVVTRNRLQIFIAFSGILHYKNLVVVLFICNSIDTTLRTIHMFINICDIQINSLTSIGCCF